MSHPPDPPDVASAGVGDTPPQALEDGETATLKHDNNAGSSGVADDAHAQTQMIDDDSAPTPIDHDAGPQLLVVDEDGERLDRALARRMPALSRSAIQKLIKDGAVTLDGQIPTRGAKTLVRAGETWTVIPAPPAPLSLEPEPIDLDILYEDDDLLAVNKDAGMVVHPSPAHPRGTLVNAVLHHVERLREVDNDPRPGIVHRLDRETSGVILVAKHPEAHRALQATFQERSIEKRYLAVLKGIPDPPQGTYETLYGRHPHQRKKFSSRVADGKSAVTHYVIVEAYPGVSLAEVVIETGRTHQIRVHFSDHGHALVGDQTYGSRRSLRDPEVKSIAYAFGRTALHAWQVRLRHPLRPKKKLRIEAPIPEDLWTLLETLRDISRRRGKDPAAVLDR